MHAKDILKYGHQTILQTIDGLAEPDWNISGACGVWSVREIIAHLASFEHLLIDVFQGILDENAPTATLERYTEEGLKFNDKEVASRKDLTVAETWAEYKEAFQKSSKIFAQIPAEKYRQAGLLAWYGAEYDLEDFLVYTFYGHKREHGAQINAFRDILEQQKVKDFYA